jgi:hypothetical protein
VAKRTRFWLTIALTVLVFPLAAVPLSYRPIALYWAKHNAHNVFANLSAEERLAMNTTPAAIVLPPVKPGAKKLEIIEIHSRDGDPLFLRCPAPESREITDGTWHLVYPQFEIFLLNPGSTVSLDAETQRLVHKNYFDFDSAANHARLDDIDAQPDLPALEHLLILLGTRAVRATPDTFWAEFRQSDRCGWIMASDAQKSGVHAVINFLDTHMGTGVMFVNQSGVAVDDVQSFLATMLIEPKRSSTTEPMPLPRD